jgi:YbbR domain-containing protein
MKKINRFAGALLISFLLWTLATSQNLSTVSLFINLNVTNIPPDMVISKISEKRLNIQVAGPKNIIQKLADYDFKAIYEIPQNTSKGDFSFSIAPSDIVAPSGAQVKSVSPSVIQISLEKTVEKDVEIKPSVVGEPASGYMVSRIELNPPKARIKGPQATLNSITQITTEAPFDVTNLAEPYRQRFKLLVDSPNVSLVNNQYTTIKVIIEPVVITKRLTNINIVTFPMEIKTQVIPENFTVDFKGPQNIIDKIIQPGINAIIDIRDFKEGQSYLLVPEFRDLPPEIQIVDRNPKKVTVKILKATVGTGK